MRSKILIAVNDDDTREILEEMFEETDFEAVPVETGTEASKVIDSEGRNLALVILDTDLPEISAQDIAKKISDSEFSAAIPIFVVSEDTSLKMEKSMLKAGATDFRKKPFDSNLVKKKLLKFIELYSVNELLAAERAKTKALEKQNELLKSGSGAANDAEGSISAASGGGASKAEIKNFTRMHDNLIELVGRIIEYRNPENHSHVRRMKGLVKIMGKHMIELYPEYGLTLEKVDMIVSAASIHDLGKQAIPDSVILKPGRFTNDEYELMKSHTLKGIDLLDSIRGCWDDEYDRIVRRIVRSHHEKYDGGGYPDGLKGDDIPIEAQLISIADTYDALVNDRVYKKAYPKDVAFNMIMAGECGVFPPKILECFKVCRGELEDWENGDLDLSKI